MDVVVRPGPMDVVVRPGPMDGVVRPGPIDKTILLIGAGAILLLFIDSPNKVIVFSYLSFVYRIYRIESTAIINNVSIKQIIILFSIIYLFLIFFSIL